MADFVSELLSLTVNPPEGSRGLGSMLAEIQVMQAAANALGKAPFAAALDQLKQLAERRPLIAAHAIERALAEQTPPQPTRSTGRRRTADTDPSLVPAYHRRLEEALGDDIGFYDVMAQLEADKKLKATDLKQLSQLFTARRAQNKRDALELIRTRHRNLMDARAKQNFNSGQTAA